MGRRRPIRVVHSTGRPLPAQRDVTPNPGAQRRRAVRIPVSLLRPIASIVFLLDTHVRFGIPHIRRHSSGTVADARSPIRRPSPRLFPNVRVGEDGVAREFRSAKWPPIAP